MISMIYARSANYCIGKQGSIPWHLPNDFAHFKRTTMGCPIIMGRKTYEDHKSALPGRLNIVVTRQEDYQAAEGILVIDSLENAISVAQQDQDHIFIIGGVSFFTRGYEICDQVFETVIDAHIDGDAFLPEFDYSGWETELIDQQQIDEKHAYSYRIYVHQRASR